MSERRDLIRTFLEIRGLDLEKWDDEELRALRRFVTGIQKRRDILEVQRQLNSAEVTDHRRDRVARAQQQQRGADITTALRELRVATTYVPHKPRPPLFVVRDEEE